MYYGELRTAIHLNETKGRINGLDYTKYLGDSRAKIGRPRKSDYLSDSVYQFAKRGKKLSRQARERDRDVKKASGISGFHLALVIYLFVMISNEVIRKVL